MAAIAVLVLLFLGTYRETSEHSPSSQNGRVGLDPAQRSGQCASSEALLGSLCMLVLLVVLSSQLGGFPRPMHVRFKYRGIQVLAQTAQRQLEGQRQLEKTTHENTMDDMRTAVVAVIATFQALSWASMGVRLCVRYFLVKRRLGWDDSKLHAAFVLGRLGCWPTSSVFIAVAMLPVVVQAVLQSLGKSFLQHACGWALTGFDLRQPNMVLGFTSTTRTSAISRKWSIWFGGLGYGICHGSAKREWWLTWLRQIVFNLSHMCIKFSYLAFYLCLMPDRRSRVVVYAGFAFVAAVGITFTALSIFLCTPVQRGWDKSVPGRCIDDASFLLSNAAFNMVADMVVFLMPVPTLWSLQREHAPTCLPYGIVADK
jgi:hypothetical protein